MDQNQSKIDQFNLDDQKRTSFLMNFVIFNEIRYIFDLLSDILIENQTKINCKWIKIHQKKDQNQ